MQERLGFICFFCRIRAHGDDLSGGAGGENIFFHFRGEGNQNVEALAQGQAVTYTTGVGRNGHLAAENVVPSSGGGGGAGGAPKGAAACGKSPGQTDSCRGL